MTWEEKLLFLMFLDYKGALKKWEGNHNKYKYGHYKIDDDYFRPTQGFDWLSSPEGSRYWDGIISNWYKLTYGKLEVASLNYSIRHRLSSDTIQVGCQTITKKDALKIADFIYECFGEEV